MSEKIDCTAKVDSGLFALILLMRFHGNGTPVESVRDLCGTDQIGIPEMLRSARQLGFNASWREVEWYQLASMPLPFIAPLLEGEFLSVVRVAEDELFVIRPGSRPANIRRAEFEEVWDKQLVIITRGADLTGFSGRWSKRLSNFVERLCRWFEHQAHAAPIDPGKSHAITDTTKADDDGLAALIMLLRIPWHRRRIRADTPSMRSGQDRCRGNAALCEGARAKGACACNELGTSRPFAPSGDCAPARRSISACG